MAKYTTAYLLPDLRYPHPTSFAHTMPTNKPKISSKLLHFNPK